MVISCILIQEEMLQYTVKRKVGGGQRKVAVEEGWSEYYILCWSVLRVDLQECYHKKKFK